MESSDVVSPSELDFEDGVYLVKLARKAIEAYVGNGVKIEPDKDVNAKLMKRGMAFVTVDKLLGSGRKELRGCIGFLQPVAPLVKVVIESAIAAATEDPRFPPLTVEELENIVIEVSVLSVPIPVKEPENIIIGKHGIIIIRGWHSGTLLPQVPVEYCWDTETFLAEGCLKAGLEADCWLDKRTKVFVYEARIFYEESPRGLIKERNLQEELKKSCSQSIT